MVKIKLTLKASSGKTAPRLIEDLLRYDPLHPAASSGNVLTQPPPIVHDDRIPPSSTSPNGCRHKFVTKQAQTLVPALDARPDPFSHYVVASTCIDCRCHLTLDVEFQPVRSTERPCPNLEFHLHHFRYTPSKPTAGTSATETQDGETWSQRHRFECTSPTCSAVATITLRSPRLTSRYLSVLLDRDKIKARVQPVLDEAPDRFRDCIVPEPITVLSNVKQYLSDAMQYVERKKVNATNKRFLASLGEGSRELLEFLGFEWSEEETDDVRFQR